MPQAAGPKKRSILEFALIFIAAYLVIEFALKTFFPAPSPESVKAGLVLRPQSAEFSMGHHPVLILENHTASGVTLRASCPLLPVTVSRVTGTGTLTAVAPVEAEAPCIDTVDVLPTKETQISLAPWKYSMFGTLGTYEVRMEVKEGTQTRQLSTRFAMTEPNALTKIFRTFVSKPLLNLLVFIASILPGHNLGLTIIILTLLIKFVLFLPTQHALEGQRKMQKLQPKIEELRAKYKGDPKRLNEETMKLWKENKVNPFQSCLPMLIQFPILIGLFYAVRDGADIGLARHLLYSIFDHLPWTLDPNFLGFNLLKPEIIVMPALLVILQFLQMKLSFAAAAKRSQAATTDPSQKMQQRIMLYGLPLMIGFFALQFPMAVSLYWGISTLFAIGQQVVVNRKVA